MEREEEQIRRLQKVFPKLVDGPSVIRQIIEQVIDERRALSKATKAFMEQVREDMETTRQFLKEFYEFKREYEAVTREMMDAVKTLKNLQDLKVMNRKLLEELTK